MTTTKIQQFQGTSKEGDFQAALEEAIHEAFEFFSRDVSDQRIAWKLIETSGSQGGLTRLKCCVRFSSFPLFPTNLPIF